jgi:CheY-like chemotaxis protein
VLIADRAAGPRDALAEQLEATGRFDVAVRAGDGFEAVEAAAALQPDLTLLALALPRLSGLEALRYVRAAAPAGVVIVSSSLALPATTGTDDGFADGVCALFDATRPARAVEARSVELPASGTSAAAARQFVDDELRALGRGGFAGIATLLVSEIVTNAVVHARSTSRVSIVESGPALRVEVTDWGDGAVMLREVSSSAIGGRGLHIVDALADLWGTVATPRRKTVWFEVGRRAQRPAGDTKAGAAASD